MYQKGECVLKDAVAVFRPVMFKNDSMMRSEVQTAIWIWMSEGVLPKTSYIYVHMYIYIYTYLYIYSLISHLYTTNQNRKLAQIKATPAKHSRSFALIRTGSKVLDKNEDKNLVFREDNKLILSLVFFVSSAHFPIPQFEGYYRLLVIYFMYLVIIWLNLCALTCNDHSVVFGFRFVSFPLRRKARPYWCLCILKAVRRSGVEGNSLLLLNGYSLFFKFFLLDLWIFYWHLSIRDCCVGLA